jgi:beta-xylosidase
MCRLALFFVAAALHAADPLLFSFFRNNGEDGLYLAASNDGLTWRPLNHDRPLLRPEVGESRLVRDPSIARAPDGTFHMVWTTSWDGKTIGYASSRDLRHWSPQRAIDVMAGIEAVANCWAPELFYDNGEWIVLWASTVAGRFPETLGTAGRRNNHRIYAARTRDFVTFTPPKLFYDPGFIVIDAALFRPAQTPKRYAMVVKNETLTPEAKHLFLTWADSLDGPWTKPSAPISGKQWAEGPSPVRIGGYWYIYFDKYRDHRYGAIRSRDLDHWEDITERIRFPAGTRHGTVFRAPRKVVQALQ